MSGIHAQTLSVYVMPIGIAKIELKNQRLCTHTLGACFVYFLIVSLFNIDYNSVQLTTKQKLINFKLHCVVFFMKK